MILFQQPEYNTNLVSCTAFDRLAFFKDKLFLISPIIFIGTGNQKQDFGLDLEHLCEHIFQHSNLPIKAYLN
jgi:hypothetical protein